MTSIPPSIQIHHLDSPINQPLSTFSPLPLAAPPASGIPSAIDSLATSVNGLTRSILGGQSTEISVS